jgi:hypothetical protein
MSVLSSQIPRFERQLLRWGIRVTRCEGGRRQVAARVAFTGLAICVLVGCASSGGGTPVPSPTEAIYSQTPPSFEPTNSPSVAATVSSPPAITPSPSAAFTNYPALGGANSTSMTLRAFVNGVEVGPVPRDMATLATTAATPGLPWNVEARTQSGRVVLRFEVPADFVLGTYDRADLSCGAVLLWVGEGPLYGPAPPSIGASSPGKSPSDCLE